MDKRAANDHLLVLQKHIKNAKAMVSGNLIRKINKLKAEKDKTENPEQVNKIDDKVNRIHDEIKLLKQLDSYNIAKQATLNPDVKHWEKKISDSKSSVEERLQARVILKNKVQSQVKSFRDEHKDCDEWINEYIEFRDKKKELLTAKHPVRLPKNPSKTTNNSTSRKENKHLQRRKSNDKFDNNRKSSRLNNKKDTLEPDSGSIADAEEESLHPSWKVKRKEKELLKAALIGHLKPQKRIKFDP